MFELFQSFSCRSLTKPSFKVGIFANKYLLGAVALSVLLQIAILYIDFFQNVFKVSPLSLVDWVTILLVASTGFIYLEIHKLVAMKKRRKISQNMP
jgi:Ca2+-transporting ATPase